MPRPDFGVHREELSGMVLECKNIAPNTTMSDLMAAFEKAKGEAKPGDEFAGNPALWPDVRGIKAVTDMLLDAIYGKD